MKAAWFPAISTHIRQTNDTIASGRHSSLLEKRLDEEISELEGAALQLRATRNACRPLLRLPPEIIGEIVELLAAIWPACSGCLPSKPTSHHTEERALGLQLGWVLFGHICRLLRSTLLARNDIWARNICSISRSPASVLLYCALAPFHIDLSNYNRIGGPGPPRQCVDFIVEHMRSSRVIMIQEGGWGNSEAIFAYLDPALFSAAHFTHLTQLKLHLSAYPRDEIVTLTDDIFLLPEMVAPNLRSLSLRNYIIPFNPFTLTGLELDFDYPTYLLSPGVLMDIIRRCHRLRSLKLKNCIPMLSTDAPGPVFIASLEEVHLTDIIGRCIGLLTHLTSPTSTRYHVECLHVATEYQSFSFFRDIAQTLRTKTSTSLTGLQIKLEIYSCTFTLYELGKPQDLEYREVNPFCEDYREHIHYHLTAVDGPQLSNMLYALSEVVSFAAIETLQITAAFHDTYNTMCWATALARFPNLGTLYLSNMPCTPALFALEPRESVQEVVQYDVAVPRLRYLWLDILDVRDTKDEVGMTGPDRSQFWRMLSSRLRAGKQLEHLRIDTLVIEEPMQANRVFIPRLKALVPFVEIDQVQERDPDTDSDDSEPESGEGSGFGSE
ncbi:hypothetical protein PENSPDRAFT_747740 [Peniophora sp. CONT]|nr:hypothetical protein PENSPDRAFT_747740 [Peniophora sp. CONT]